MTAVDEKPTTITEPAADVERPELALGPYQIMPLMTPEQFKELKEDIRLNGVQEPIVFDQNHKIVDGHHRFRAFEELTEEGVELPMFNSQTVTFRTEEEKINYIFSRNVKRRHLTSEQRVQLAIEMRKRYGYGYERLGALLGVSAMTIWRDLQTTPPEVKKELERVITVGADGRSYVATHTPLAVMAPPPPRPIVTTFTPGAETLRQAAQQVRPTNLEAEPQVDKAEELRNKWQTIKGQVWEISTKSGVALPHRVMCGDATSSDDVAKLMGSQKGDVLWTDPPYGVSYVGKTKDKLTIENDALGADPKALRKFLVSFMKTVEPYLIPGAPFYICHPAGRLHLEFGNAILEAKWVLHETLIWVKDSMVLGHSDYHFKHEPVYYGYTPGAEGRVGRGNSEDSHWYGDHSQVSVFEIPRPKRSESHPTMKPVDLVVAHIKNSTTWKGIVVDTFIGSGAALAACEVMGRTCFGMDRDPKYLAVTLQRADDMGLSVKLLS